MSLGQQTPAASQDRWVSIDQLPPGEQWPAAPFFVGAYSVIWLIAMFYIWRVWRRVIRLEGDVQVLRTRREGQAGNKIVM